MKKLALVVCKNCNKKIMPHRMCPYCGSYKGREIVDVAASVKTKAVKK